MDFEAAKTVLTSKSIWGSIISILAMLAPQLGINLEESQSWIDDAVMLFGAGFAIYGRIVAKGTITKLV